MINKQKILEILNKESVSENSSNNNRIIIEQDFEIIADEIVKLFAIPFVIVPKCTLLFHLKALTKQIEDSHNYGFDDVLEDYIKSNAL